MSTDVLYKHIEQTSDVMGGKPRITGRRITVQNVVVWHEQMGKSPDEISTEYDLTLAEVHAALSYYFDHHEEIDQSIQASASYVKTVKARKSSVLAQKLAKQSRG